MSSPWLDRFEDIKYDIDVSWIPEFIIVVASGLIIALIISSLISKIVSNKASKHYTILIKSITYYGLLLLTIVIALPISPINLAALGAVLTFAVGFAARTPLSNVINGLIIVFEAPFVIGDEIALKDLRGRVIAIDLLSVKILTPGNVVIRLPNENISLNQVTNFSKQKIRKLDVTIYSSYNKDLKDLESKLLAIAKENMKVLETPPPYLSIDAFNEDNVKLVFSLWLPTSDFYQEKSAIRNKVYSILEESPKTIINQSK